jgi:hypothetical protein
MCRRFDTTNTWYLAISGAEIVKGLADTMMSGKILGGYPRGGGGPSNALNGSDARSRRDEKPGSCRASLEILKCGACSENC